MNDDGRPLFRLVALTLGLVFAIGLIALVIAAIIVLLF